jgi:NitT/TauT family transport system substrate-binding protein
MNAHDAGRAALMGFLLAATLASGATAAETGIRFSLDFKFEGPSAPFLLPLDKGYYKAEGLNVTIEPSSGSIETIERVASGAFDMGFADINALIRSRRRQSGNAKRDIHGLQPAGLFDRRAQKPWH